MLSLEQIAALAAFDAHGSPVLSVYLDLDPARQLRRSYRMTFAELVKAARAWVEAPASRRLAEEAARVQAWLDAEVRRGMGLAVFSCAPRSFWRAELLADRVTNHLTFGPTPDVAPLLRIADEYERYAVAAVERLISHAP